jgi:hypothetical protein
MRLFCFFVVAELTLRTNNSKICSLISSRRYVSRISRLSFLQDHFTVDCAGIFEVGARPQRAGLHLVQFVLHALASSQLMLQPPDCIGHALYFFIMAPFCNFERRFNLDPQVLRSAHPYLVLAEAGPGSASIGGREGLALHLLDALRGSEVYRVVQGAGRPSQPLELFLQPLVPLVDAGVLWLKGGYIGLHAQVLVHDVLVLQRLQVQRVLEVALHLGQPQVPGVNPKLTSRAGPPRTATGGSPARTSSSRCPSRPVS